MQTYLTPKDVAARLQISIDSARNEMRKMRHKEIGGGQCPRLRVAEKDFEAYMQPAPPLPRPSDKRATRTSRANHTQRAIPYRKGTP